MCAVFNGEQTYSFTPVQFGLFGSSSVSVLLQSLIYTPVQLLTDII